MFQSKQKISLAVIFIIFTYVIRTDFNIRQWTTPQGVISSDVSVYYEYLPAFFIHHDLSLDFKNASDFKYNDKFFAHILPNKKNVIKMSMGLSYLYLPFFALAHLYCEMTGIPADGFSDPYEIMLLVSSLFYGVTGLFFLRKLLLVYFTEAVTAFCLLSISLGTNFITYATKEACMSHVYLFCMITIFIWYVRQWYINPKLKYILWIGISVGIISLIRPTNVLVFLIFLLYDTRKLNDIKSRIMLFIKRRNQLILLAALFILVWTPQLMYWKMQSGQFLFFSYVGERFYFGHPHIIDGFFSYRKGWLLYSPVMIFSLFGFIIMKKKAPEFFSGILLFFTIGAYVILSWWCWWYGGGFGLRAFIDMYGVLAIPMGCFFSYVYEKIVWKKMVFTLGVLLLIWFSVFQNNQYYVGSIHWDSMTKEAYWASFLKTNPPPGWHYLLKEPDYAGAQSTGKEKE